MENILKFIDAKLENLEKERAKYEKLDDTCYAKSMAIESVRKATDEISSIKVFVQIEMLNKK